MGKFRKMLERTSMSKKKQIKNQDLATIEKQLDRIFKDVGIDVDLRDKHFIKRVKERTANNDISVGEIKKVFLDAHKKFKNEMVYHAKNDPGFQTVLQDLITFLNIPVELGPDETPNDDTPYGLKAITFLKKKDPWIKKGSDKWVTS